MKHVLHLHRISALVALAALLATITLATADESMTPGLVREKPATGRFVETDRGFMVAYEAKIPGSDVTYKMVPIPGGKFTMGSPESEADRGDDEGPQFVVHVEPFWMGACEVTWAEYKEFMSMHDLFKSFQSHGMRQVKDENMLDAVTAPSNLYDPSFTFVSGERPTQPAVTMTQFAAKQYTKWLSGLTGQFHRLPSEAEWEYACRAGTTTAYSFGEDASQIDDYAWHYKNADDRSQDVGQKKPNPWGLHDIHGNVAEWCLDQYEADAYKKFAGKEVKAADTIVWPTKLYPRVLRGGAWDFDAEDCRSATRFPEGDEDDWKSEDPNIPYSPWWYTTHPSTCVGMRIIRPLNAPDSKEAMDRYWKADVKRDILDVVEFRIKSEGRGAYGIVDPNLPADIEKLKELKRNSQ